MTETAPEKKTLELRQTWFLGVAALAVILMFAFVILPYVDQPAKLSGQEAPDFDLELISGGDPGDRIRLSDLRGKPVLLDFWASWCAPCRAQSQVLSEVAPELGEDAYVLGIATSDQREDAEGFVHAEQPRYPNAYDEGDQVARQMRVTQLPTLALVDSAGTIRALEARVLSAQEIIELIRSAQEN